MTSTKLTDASEIDSTYNPAAEAFKNFDQDQASSMMGSLHLDAEDEPRRGASRANSVRFDESAKHGNAHVGHGSRSASEFYPSRTGSAFGSHPLGERTASHKSEGRQSSTHSARLNSIGIESRPLSATVASFIPSSHPLAPPPGLFILGPVPSIIRCWLDTNFSNDSLLYAAVCTGSYKSIIRISLLQRLGYQNQVVSNQEGHQTIKLPVYLPEATVQQSSSRSGSPAPQLPTLTTEFTVDDRPSAAETMDIFLGCDVLRFRNADIHFSLDRLTLFDDERNKVSVPLVRPENAALFQNLQISTTVPNSHGSEQVQSSHDTEKPTEDIQETNDKVLEDQIEVAEKQGLGKEEPSPQPSPPSVIGESKKSLRGPDRMDDTANSKAVNRGKATNGAAPSTPSKPEGNNIWGSWRRDSTHDSQPDFESASSIVSSSYRNAGRGRGMKVLKPARLNTSSRTSSAQQPLGFDAAPSRFGEGARSAGIKDETQSPATATDRKSASSEIKPPLSSKPNSANPVGGASAFGWLNSGPKSLTSYDQ